MNHEQAINTIFLIEEGTHRAVRADLNDPGATAPKDCYFAFGPHEGPDVRVISLLMGAPQLYQGLNFGAMGIEKLIAVLDNAYTFNKQVRIIDVIAALQCIQDGLITSQLAAIDSPVNPNKF